MELAHLITPAVLLCPPLAPDRASVPWAGRLADELRAAGVPVIDPHPEQTPTSAAPADPDDRTETSLAPGRVDDRLAVACWVADQAVAVTSAGLDRPLLVVAAGSAGRGLPALGMSQRAARHNVVGYVLVDGLLPPPSRAAPDWPDAPVLYVQTPTAEPLGRPAARLRGWTHVQADPVTTIVAQVRSWPDGVA